MVAVVGGMAAVIGVRSTVVPGRWHPWFNGAVLVGALAIVPVLRLSAEELGLGRAHLARGARWGGAAAALISSVIVVSSLVPATSGLFADDRADVSLGAMLLKVVIVIPVATVFLEEFLFRGVLLGLLLRTYTALPAIAWSALTFGCWHIVTAWNTSDGSTASRVAAVVGTVIATTAAGGAFGWLRYGSKSLVAPIAAHIATNSVAFATAWVLAN